MVSLAVKQNPKAIDYASPLLQQDPQILKLIEI